MQGTCTRSTYSELRDTRYTSLTGTFGRASRRSWISLGPPGWISWEGVKAVLDLTWSSGFDFLGRRHRCGVLVDNLQVGFLRELEDFLQDNVRNQLIQFELLLTTATFVVAIFGVVAGIFGMNFEIPLFDDPDAFKWVLLSTGVSGLIIFGAFVWFFRYKRLMPL